MTISVFDLFSIGVGPSSSHTVGPMRAAARFVRELAERSPLDAVRGVSVDLFGSLAATGAGHGTPSAVLLGLEGNLPESVDDGTLHERPATIDADGILLLGGCTRVPFTSRNIVLHLRESLDFHANGMALGASDERGKVLHEETYFSVGGGFVVTEAEGSAPPPRDDRPLSFGSGKELMALAESRNERISDVMLAYESADRTAREVRDGLLHIRDVMQECQRNGLGRSGELPGGLRVRRRAREWFERLDREDPDRDPRFAQDWVNLVALAVNEENASGGRVVTAPTNGAAGIIPAVMHYATGYTEQGIADPDGAAVRFLLTAGAVGSLYKERASISGAEAGCQGEVGSAASMAAAGLAEVLGGSVRQVENAAEIAMEHSLGLTCDPVGGLVQIPCIERNAISAGKAINAAHMALRGDGSHRVSLDEVIETMRTTGRDMLSIYKETSRGGLAVNVVEC